jgi:hypothetical protein
MAIFYLSSILAAVAFTLRMPLLDAAPIIAKANHRFTPGQMNTFYEPPCASPTSAADFVYGPYKTQDGDYTNYLHSDIYSLVHWVKYDLIEQRALSRIRLWAGQSCCYTRDDSVQMWVGDNPAGPTASGNAQCSFPAGFASASSYREFSCTGLFGRYVWAYQTCASSGCIMNMGGAFVVGVKLSS